VTITLDITPELEQRVLRAAAHAGLEPEAYIVETLRDHLASDAQTQHPPAPRHLPAQEADLLTQINHALSNVEWTRYHALIAKRQDETLMPDEQQELVALADEIEQANARRMGYLVELAHLRNVTLSALMQQLGLTPVSGT
jgi:hypothetical protein